MRKVKNPLINIIKLPKIKDDGFLIFAQEKTHLPFPIKRIYYILDPKPGLSRGFHTHKTLQQILFCIQGSIKLTLDNRKERKSIVLKKPEEGIILSPFVWYEMHDFRKNTILLVLASDIYREEDYIRDYFQFRQAVRFKINQ